MSNGFKFCVYGAQFGSEGKGCAAEWLIRSYRTKPNLVVLGENAPNSGHNNSLGKTRSLPVSAYFATHVILGPDSAIDPHMLIAEVTQIKLHNPKLQVFVHENAAIIGATDIDAEAGYNLAKRIGSTQSGGGFARTQKALMRLRDLVMQSWAGVTGGAFEIVDRVRYHELLQIDDADWLIECSQGLMLDMNLGYYPFVTSRSTHPRVVIERNGWGPSSEWSLIGVYRSYPIRTGGNSGPTGGKELSWEILSLKPEIAAVTKRVRRVFEFNGADFIYSLNLVKPGAMMFTHLDYLPESHRDWHGFQSWLARKVFGGTNLNDYDPLRTIKFMGSTAPSNFTYFGQPSLGTQQSVSGQAMQLPRSSL
jgi:adenylosuccinate synthase